MITEVVFGLLIPLYGLLTVVVLFIAEERALRRERGDDEAGQ
jgi:hypothetical protein